MLVQMKKRDAIPSFLIGNDGVVNIRLLCPRRPPATSVSLQTPHGNALDGVWSLRLDVPPV